MNAAATHHYIKRNGRKAIKNEKNIASGAKSLMKNRSGAPKKKNYAQTYEELDGWWRDGRDACVSYFIEFYI